MVFGGFQKQVQSKIILFRIMLSVFMCPFASHYFRTDMSIKQFEHLLASKTVCGDAVRISLCSAEEARTVLRLCP